MKIVKLGKGGVLTSYICNCARKMRRLIVEQVHEAAEALRKGDSDDIHFLEVYCWKHLRNVWLKGIPKSLSNLLFNTLREELYEINWGISVLTSTIFLLRDVDREFSLCVNYPK